MSAACGLSARLRLSGPRPRGAWTRLAVTKVSSGGPWRASRSDLDGALLHPVTGRPEPAAAVVSLLLEHCRDALADAGDTDAVAGLLAALFARGNGASFQRSAYRRDGRLPDVIREVIRVTDAG